jgi:serine/threonine protein phosphatase PrpC
MEQMQIRDASFSYPGRKSDNEDAFFPALRIGDEWWAAVADGMGGHPGGELASSTVIGAVRSRVANGLASDIPSLFLFAREELKRAAESGPEYSRMGTTLSLIRLRGDTAQVGHVGDSRIYHLRSHGIVTRTVDQTEVNELVQRGILSKAAARRYPRRNVLLSVLAGDRDYDLYLSEFDVEPGDRILLVTDGVSSKLLAQEIQSISSSSKDAKSFSDGLLAELRLREPDDDHTAVCLDILP